MRRLMNWRIVVLPIVLGLILAGCKLTGRVTTSDGDPIEGVTMQLSGASSDETTTDANGEYLFEVPNTEAVYTVTPVSEDWVFDPASRDVDTSEAAESRSNTIDGIDFTGRKTAYTLQGRVTLNTGEVLPYVKVTLSGTSSRTVQIDADGYYSFQVPIDEATYTLSAAKGDNFVFTPESRIVTINDDTVPGDGVIDGLDFIGEAVSYSLIGIVETSGGDRMAWLTIRLEDEQGGHTLTTTNSSGVYFFQVPVASASYTLRPMPLPDSKYVFDPETINVTIDENTTADHYNRIPGFDFTGIYRVSPEYQDITYYHDCDSSHGPLINGGESDLHCSFIVSEDGAPNGSGFWDFILFSITPFGATELYEGNFSIEQGRIGFYMSYIPAPDEIDLLFCDSTVNFMNLDDPTLFYVGLDENGMAVQYGGVFKYFENAVPHDAWAFVEMKFADNSMTLIIDGAVLGTVTGVSSMSIPDTVIFHPNTPGKVSFEQILASDDPGRDLYIIRNTTTF